MMYAVFLMCLMVTCTMIEAKCRCRRFPVPQSELLSVSGQTCGGNQDCAQIGPDFECFNGNCLCTPGFHLNSGQCQEECTTYGTTYIEYAGIDVQCAGQAEFNVNTMPECQQECDGILICLSYSFDTATNVCIIRTCDPLNDFTNPAFTPIVNTNAPATTSLYVKNCA